MSNVENPLIPYMVACLPKNSIHHVIVCNIDALYDLV